MRLARRRRHAVPLRVILPRARQAEARSLLVQPLWAGAACEASERVGSAQNWRTEVAHLPKNDAVGESVATVPTKLYAGDVSERSLA